MTDPTGQLRQRCDWLLTAMLGRDGVEAWWQSPNRAFDMRTAREQFELDPQRVYRYLMDSVDR